MSHRRALFLALAVLAPAWVLSQDLTARLTVDVDHPGHPISPMFFGMMTEEINHAYDGGLYAELIRNRAFSDSADKPAYWTQVGGADGILVLQHEAIPGTALTSSLRVDAHLATSRSPIGVSNPGYWGIPVKPHTAYKASFYARGVNGFRGRLRLAIQSEDGSVTFASINTSPLGANWTQIRGTLKTGGISPSVKNRFTLTSETPGVFELGQVSLFPPTYQKRPNGNRADLMDLMAGLRPKFLRLPGGNYLEGNTIAERFDWKKTIGPISARPGHPCPWGYPSTDGMGLLEFLNWCEDLKMEPLLAVYAGYSLRGEHIPAGPGLEPYLQDALDEVEYITGGTNTVWGARRALDGHPQPFPLHYVEIGNEDWFDRSQSYEGRFAQFYDGFRKRFPNLKLISTMPVQNRVPDLIDDHFYRSAGEMERDSTHYDHYDRKGPKIFVGEWATTEGRPTPNMRAALGDAAWLTGLERNSDVVELEAYAPLFVNVNPGAAQWGTNLIGYDAGTSFGSPSYWVQALFGQNTGDSVLPYDLDIHQPPLAPVVYRGQVGVGAYRTDVEYRDLTVTSGGTTAMLDLSKASTDWKLGPGDWSVHEGALRQTGDHRGALAFTKGVDLGEGTIEVKARKISGREGFFILFHASRDAFWQWNVGGWDNKRSAVQRVSGGTAEEVGESTPLTVETGRWYDLKIELANGMIRCFLDGKMVTEVKESIPQPSPLYVAASQVTHTGEVLLKLVNVSDKPVDLDLTLEGKHSFHSDAIGWVLSGEPMDQNSIDMPNKVAPKQIVIVGNQAKLPAHSVTVLRLRRRS